MANSPGERIRDWWLDRSIRFKGLTVAAIPVVPLVLLSLVYFPMEWQARALADDLRFALELEQRSQEVVISIQDVRGEVRSHLLLADHERHSAYQAATDRVAPAMDRLAEAIRAGQIDEEERIEVLRSLVDRKLETLDAIFLFGDGSRHAEIGIGSEEAPGLGPPDGLTESEALTVIREGGQIMDSIRVVIGPFRSRADSVLTASGRTSSASSWLPPAVVGGASLLGILGGILGGLLFSSGVAGRLAALERGTQSLARSDAPLIAHPSAQDEIGRLARSMARANRVLKERQVELQKSEERFALAVRGSSDGIWDWDLESGEVYYSPRWKEILGYFEDEIDHTMSDFESRVHPDDLDRVRADIDDYMEGRTGVYESEFRMRHKDGTWRWMLSRGRSVRDPQGKVIRMTGSHADLTLRKQREGELREARLQAEAATRSKSAFLAAMSHELRTPLNAIIGFGELLEDGPSGNLEPKQVRYVHNIVSSGRHLLELINDILDLSKVEAGRMELHLSTLEPVALLSSSIEIIAGEARRKEIDVLLDLPERLPSLRADEGRLKQIIYNLLSNAVKFTEPGGRVTLGAKVDRAAPGSGSEFEDRGSRLRIWVEDSGIGISEDDRRRVFEEFEQVDSTLARSEQGTGLGLSLVRKLVALHDGEVRLESQPGHGSTFTVILPLKGPDRRGREVVSEPLEHDLPPAVGTPVPPDAPRILIVEDDPWAGQLLTEYLTDAGYRTSLARESDEAVRLAREELPDAITLDVLLPGRDGWEILRELKSDPLTARIPVFVVTMVDDDDAGYALGAVACFRKPVERGTFLAAIEGVAPLRTTGPLRVLVVDDDPDAIELVRGVLEGEEYVVIEADGGQEGIDVARRELPDLVVLDLMMPDISGFDVARALRDSPATREIPILVWTARELTPEDRDWLSTRIQAVGSKTERGALRSELQRLLGQRSKEVVTE